MTQRYAQAPKARGGLRRKVLQDEEQNEEGREPGGGTGGEVKRKGQLLRLKPSRMHTRHKPASGPSWDRPFSQCYLRTLGPQPAPAIGRLPPRVSFSLHVRGEEAAWFQMPGQRDKSLCLSVPHSCGSGEWLQPSPIFEGEWWRAAQSPSYRAILGPCVQTHLFGQGQGPSPCFSHSLVKS